MAGAPAMLTAWLERSATRAPDKAAIVWGATRLSHAELAARAGQCAAGLAALGVGAGDVVALVLPNRPEFVIAFFATMRLGAIVAPASAQATAAELERQLGDAAPRVIVCDTRRHALSRAVAARLAHPPRVIAAGDRGPDGFDALGARLKPPPDRGSANARALYLYTSGSTDSFKRVCCTQSNLWHEAENFVIATGQTAADTIFCAVPLYHSYGFGNGLLDAARLGATLVLEADTEVPFAARQAAILAQLRAEDASVFLGVPFQYELLATSAEDVAASFAGVRWCVSSGDALRRRVFDAFRAKAGQPIRSLYGSTEAGSIAMNTGPAADVGFDDLGPPLANVVVEARGPAGDLWVRSPTLPPGGYDNRPELNPGVFRDGFYNTGDLGRIDARGHLVMTGRRQSFIEIGGHKVDATEVEEVLLAHPAVREAAVVGSEVAAGRQMLKAVLAAEETCREADILAYCRRLLAPFKVPRIIEFRELLPRSPLGKVLRAELAETAGWLLDVPAALAIPPGSRAQQTGWLAQMIGQQVAAIIGQPADDIPRALPFQDLGLDSLGAVELQERLSRLTGVALSITTLWNYPSVDAYAAFLLDAMTGTVPPEAPAPIPDTLDGVPDAEIAALLARELGLSAEGA